MKGIVVVALLAMVACGPHNGVVQSDVTARQAPSTTTPGIQISGDASFGIKRGF